MCGQEKDELGIKVGNAVRKKREETGMTVEELSKLLEVEKTYLLLAESGNRMFSLVNLVKLSSIFACTTDEILCI